MLLIRIVNSFLIGVSVIGIVACSSVHRDWEKATKSNHISAYQHFLKNHAGSEFDDRAHKKIDELTFQENSLIDTVEEYQSYLENFPNGRHREEAQQSIDRLIKEEKVWQDVQSKNTIKGYQAFLKEFPNTKHSLEIDPILERALENAWQVAENKNSIEAYRSFEKEFPESKYSKIVEEKIEPLRSKNAIPLSPAALLVFRNTVSDLLHPYTLSQALGREKVLSGQTSKLSFLDVTVKTLSDSRRKGGNDDITVTLKSVRSGNSFANLGVWWKEEGVSPSDIYNGQIGEWVLRLLDPFTSSPSKLDDFQEVQIRQNGSINYYFNNGKGLWRHFQDKKNSLVVFSNTRNAPKESNPTIGDNPSELLRRAGGAFSKGSKAEAQQLYQQAADLGNPDGHFALAYKFSFPSEKRAFHYAEAGKQGHEKALEYALDTLFFKPDNLFLSNPQRALEVYTLAREINPSIPEHPNVSTIIKCAEAGPFDAEEFLNRFNLTEMYASNNSPYFIWRLAQEASAGGQFGVPDSKLVLQLVCRGGHEPTEKANAISAAHAWWVNGLTPNFELCKYVKNTKAVERCSLSPRVLALMEKPKTLPHKSSSGSENNKEHLPLMPKDSSGQSRKPLGEQQEVENLSGPLLQKQLSQGNHFLNQGELDKSLTAYEGALLTDPQSLEAHDGIATIFTRQEKWDDAIRAWQHVLEFRPDYLKAHQKLGLIFAIKNEWKDSILAFENALRFQPNDDWSGSLLEQARIEHSDLSFTSEQYQENEKKRDQQFCLRKVKDDWESSAVQGDPQAQFCLALQYYSTASKVMTQKAAFWYRKATLNHKEIMPTRALPCLGKISCLLSSISLKAMLGLRDIDQDLGKEYPKEQLLVLEKDPFVTTLGMTLIQNGKPRQGLDVLIREGWLLKVAAQLLLETMYKYGLENVVHRHDQKIFDFFVQSAEEGVPRSQAFLAFIYLQGLGVPPDKTKALDWSERALKGNSDLSDALLVRGVIKGEKGAHEEAIDAFRHVTRLLPDKVVGFYNLGVELQHIENWTESIETFNKSILIDSNHADSWTHLGISYGQIGDYDKALEAHQKALELEPKDPRRHFNFGSTLLSKGDVDGAMSAYKKALRIDPNFEYAKIAIMEAEKRVK